MKLKGLKALFLGDSITYGSGASSLDKNYVNLLAKYTGLNTVNYGVGGTRIARQTKASACTDWDYDFNARARIMDKEADIIGVFGGTNDYGHGFAPIGKPTDTDEYTFYGALNCLYSYLIRTYPKAFIFVMTPLHRANEERVTGDGFKPPMLPLSGYVDIIREMAGKYSLPVLDFYATSGIYPDIEESKLAWTTDGLLPNNDGYEKLTGMIISFLESNYYEK